MFETPRTRLRNLANAKLAAPHHEAGRERRCIKLTGICFSVAVQKPASFVLPFSTFIQANVPGPQRSQIFL
jgi:hypothetical protein